MNAVADWLAMGGYAGFVWSAYGIAALVLGGIAFHSWRRHRLSAALLERLQARQGE